MGARIIYLDLTCTYRCNLACPYCYVKTRREMAPELTTEEIRQLMEDADTLGAEYFCLTGGEPLLRKDIKALLKEGTRHSFYLELITNGTLISKSIADLLAERGVLTYVSIDSHKREELERIRGPGTWELVMKGLEYLRKAKATFSLIMTVSSTNYLHVTDYLAFAREAGASWVTLMPLMEIGRGYPYVPGPHQVEQALKLAEEACEEMDYHVEIWCLPFAKYLVRSDKIEVVSCPTEYVDVSPTGDLLLCDIMGVPVVNLRGKGLLEAYAEFLEDPLVKDIDDPDKAKGKCLKCYRRLGGCERCCARPYFKNGDPLGPDPLCTVKLPQAGPLNRGSSSA